MGRGLGGIESFCEREHGLGDLGAQSQLAAATKRFAQSDVLFFCKQNQCVLGGRADASLGCIQDPSEGERVRGVCDGHQVGNRILDFGPLIELCSPDHPIGNTRANKNVLECASLGVRPIKHGHLRVGNSLTGELNNLIGHELGLIVGAVPGETNDLLTRAEISEKVLGFAVKVVADNCVGSIKDVLCGPVILLQEHDRGARKISLELGDVANIGTPKGVNRLIRVPHHRQ